ncbi:MAG TPA: YchJ family metal-binding protein [Sulfuricurvum sp.]|nr:YchJ family metal-binding protein [Sulfuricurvum sp.]
MKISANTPCPCHSGEKYKKCCHPYHQGILPSNALKLMRSRYCAYALGLSDYIIQTTHCNHPDFTDDLVSWRASIDAFSQTTDFTELKIMEFIDGDDVAYVTFKAVLNGHPFEEKSRFFKVGEKWLYESGEFH